MQKKIPATTQLQAVRVLIVEDAPDNRLLICRILESEGALVSAVSSGPEAISMANAAVFDVVLMDIQMSEMDGYEATERLRNSGFCRPIIAFTAHAMREDQERAMLSGFNDYLSKPVNREKLVATIKRWSEIPVLCHIASSGPEQITAH